MATELELVGRLAFAALLGSVIGYERERLSWAPAHPHAGVRRLDLDHDKEVDASGL